ncbi:hypothetical protein ZEAMMB73_Zm00001d021681 [Zea mays]|uniref:Uncharacterized protein n=1 Tax=Zea mays TaxID=4577 RepID=A0A1D6ERX7_MAIZE|nr:hypothetical protein ZEAMMB73_Zm00001d005983 [Zea mays]ONM57991.1 hypothetical protein ZEAMMB73_Zm00001d021681 [Zea mays]
MMLSFLVFDGELFFSLKFHGESVQKSG